MRVLILVLLASCATKTAPPPTVVTIERPREDKFYTHRSEQWVKDLVSVANCVMNLPEFWAEVEVYPKFTFTSDDSKLVSARLRHLPAHEVKLYMTKNPLSSAIAYVVPSRPHEVNLNTRKHPREMSAMVATITHEYSHPEYGHGDNSPKGKEDSVPYAIGRIAQKHSSKCQSSK
jgi:hypothetical protein